MSDFIKSAIAWKLAFFKGMNGWILAVCLVLFASDFDWDHASKFAKARWIIMGLCAGFKFLDGFLDQTVNNIRASRNPLGLTVTTSTGNTETTTKP